MGIAPGASLGDRINTPGIRVNPRSTVAKACATVHVVGVQASGAHAAAAQHIHAVLLAQRIGLLGLTPV